MNSRVRNKFYFLDNSNGEARVTASSVEAMTQHKTINLPVTDLN